MASIIFYESARAAGHRRLAGLAEPTSTQVRGLKTLKKSVYGPRRPLDPGKHTIPRAQMLEFLGPKALNGDHSSNPFCYSPWNQQPKYLPHMKALNRRFTAYDLMQKSPSDPLDQTRSTRLANEASLLPFPNNSYVRTAFQLSDSLKQSLIQAFRRGDNITSISSKYGVKKERIDAIVRLDEIEKQMEKNDEITPDMTRFSTRMSFMFPVTDARMADPGFRENDNSLAFEQAITRQQYRSTPSNLDPTGDRNVDEFTPPPEAETSLFHLLPEGVPFTSADAAKLLEVDLPEDYIRESRDLKLRRVLSFDSKTDVDEVLKQYHGHEIAVSKEPRFVWTASPAKSGVIGYRYGNLKDKRRNRPRLL
ncbi:mitochondrial 37S ribosomal protein mS45 [Lipomyces oligophaga]|uniref:mitochondrial 37S ribosomal protein mS45 n=1 Tax=Lipomyces oligophaga TaxID=45792 RepID=UPI0034CDF197